MAKVILKIREYKTYIPFPQIMNVKLVEATWLEGVGVENVVYIKDEKAAFKDEKYIAYDFATGLDIARAEFLRDLKIKVESLKNKIADARTTEKYKTAIINDTLL